MCSERLDNWNGVWEALQKKAKSQIQRQQKSAYKLWFGAILYKGAGLKRMVLNLRKGSLIKTPLPCSLDTCVLHPSRCRCA